MKAVHFVRSLGFYLVALVITPPFSLIAILSRPLPPLVRYAIVSKWAATCVFVLKTVCGLKVKVEGRENLPATPAVALVKHQSAWETIALQTILPPQVYVLKRELLKIPFFGWGLGAMPFIAIDRAAGLDALGQVVDQGKARLAEGFWVVIFPEGTRVPPGQKKRYKMGGAHLAVKSGAPVVPVAHNAGELWPRNSFTKTPGTITVCIGPAIDTSGLTADEVNRQAEAFIEGAMRRISPHRYPDVPPAA